MGGIHEAVAQPSSATLCADEMTRKHVCPECGSKAIEREPPADVLERLILMLRRKQVYRCIDCDRRFSDRPLSKR